MLVKDNQWIWGEAQQRAFKKVKEMLTTSPLLTLFDPALETTVSADASSYGLGATLQQREQDGNLEQRYAQIGKEALALSWACERYSQHLVGMEFQIQTDHKQFVPMFSVKALDELPLRVQRFRLGMMRFRSTMSHVPGEDLVVADMFSRAPVGTPTPEDVQQQHEGAAYIATVLKSVPASDKLRSRKSRNKMRCASK